ncbi:hypothetical protein AOLI_G00249220 [Acnodon oligacanthus]
MGQQSSSGLRCNGARRREEGRGLNLNLMLNHRFILSICSCGHISVTPTVHLAHLDTPHLDILIQDQ